MMKTSRRVAPWGAALLALLMVGGCSQQRIRDEAQTLLRSGQYEQAVGEYEAGLQDHPRSALLRGGLLQARAEVTARLIAEAAGARAAREWDVAQRTLERAQKFDPGNTRITALLAELAVERRQHAALAEAQSLLTAKRADAALRVVSEALKDNPRHTELLALQRRVELDLRLAQQTATRNALAEARPISLDFRDASLRTVLDVVSRNSGINFIFDKDIPTDVRVTVYLRSARVEDAIDLITSTHRLTKKVIDSKTVLIYPNTPDKQREHQEQVVKVFHLASADAKGAAAFLRSMLKVKEPFVDERSNMLAIRESPEMIAMAERLLMLYDTSEPEVLLEVEVMEVSSNRLTELGIKFPEAIGLTPLPPPGSEGLTLSNIRGLDSSRIGLTVSGLLLNLKRDVGDFNTLANPRIRAKNKQQAKVMIGDKVPVVTATTGTGGFVSDSVSYLDVGLKLEVEPTVYADDEVSMKVALEVSSLAREIKTASGSLAYQIGTRNASTVLRLRDGETQLLAGLISSEDRSSASRVPGVGDLPVLGRLFSSQRDDSTRTELVLAITPRVLRNFRRPEATETELWVGTEALPRMRVVGAGAAPADAAADAPASPRAGPAAPAGAPDGAGPAAERPAPEVSPLRWNAPSSVKAGDTFAVTLALRSPADLRGASLQLKYATQHLQLLGIEEGEFFKQGGATTSFTHEADATSGRIRAGMLRNDASAARGEGKLVSLRMKALRAGTGDVVLEDLQYVGMVATAKAPVPPKPLAIEVKE